MVDSLAEEHLSLSPTAGQSGLLSATLRIILYMHIQHVHVQNYESHSTYNVHVHHGYICICTSVYTLYMHVHVHVRLADRQRADLSVHFPP